MGIGALSGVNQLNKSIYIDNKGKVQKVFLEIRLKKLKKKKLLGHSNSLILLFIIFPKF